VLIAGSHYRISVQARCPHKYSLISTHHYYSFSNAHTTFDTVGWTSGRASGL